MHTRTMIIYSCLIVRVTVLSSFAFLACPGFFRRLLAGEGGLCFFFEPPDGWLRFFLPPRGGMVLERLRSRKDVPDL